MLSRYRGKTKCYECNGSRLKKEVNHVKINSKSIADLVNMSIYELSIFFQDLKLNDYEKQVSERILKKFVIV